jgi:membrane protease subunit HflC
MKTLFSGLGLVILIVLAVLGFSSFYTVDETEQAIVVQFGKPLPGISGPGLHLKVPFIQDVIYIDSRILDLDSPVQEVIASDQKRLVVDTFSRYKITDPLRFYQTFNNINRANSQLADILNSATRRVLGDATFEAIVRDNRSNLMNRIRAQMNAQAEGFGVEIVDVKIRRADLPEANSQAVFQRMQTERQREATEIRAQGEEAARRIRSRADRNVTVLLAEAERESQQIRGQGDAERNRIYAEAFTQDPDFFAFYRSMQAYERGIGRDTRLVISPNSDFFRFFGSIQGTGNSRTTNNQTNNGNGSSNAQPGTTSVPLNATPQPAR